MKNPLHKFIAMNSLPVVYLMPISLFTRKIYFNVFLH